MSTKQTRRTSTLRHHEATGRGFVELGGRRIYGSAAAKLSWTHARYDPQRHVPQAGSAGVSTPLMHCSRIA